MVAAVLLFLRARTCVQTTHCNRLDHCSQQRPLSPRSHKAEMVAIAAVPCISRQRRKSPRGDLLSCLVLCCRMEKHRLCREVDIVQSTIREAPKMRHVPSGTWQAVISTLGEATRCPVSVSTCISRDLQEPQHVSTPDLQHLLRAAT